MRYRRPHHDQALCTDPPDAPLDPTASTTTGALNRAPFLLCYSRRVMPRGKRRRTPKPAADPLDVARRAIVRADSLDAALGWLRSSTADRDYCRDLRTAAQTRQALATALERDEPARFVALLATAAETIARMQIDRADPHNPMYGRITAQDCARSTGISFPTCQKRVILHPEYLKIGRRHTIPAGCLDDIRKQPPRKHYNPTHLHTPEMYARRSATHRAKKAALEAARAERIRAAYEAEADRRRALLEKIRNNPAPVAGFSSSNGKPDLPKFEPIAVKEVERVNVETIVKLTGLAQATASRRVKKHPKYKKIGIQNTIPLTCVDDIRDGVMFPRHKAT